MTDVRRVLARIADQCTDAIMAQAKELDLAECLRIANEALVAIREQAQDALGALMQETKQ